MSWLDEKRGLLLVVLFFAVAMVVAALGMRSDVALVPLLAGVPLIALTLLALAVSRTDRRPAATLQSPPQSPAGDTEDVGGRYFFLGWIAALLFAVYFIGIMWASGLGILAWVRLRARIGWPVAILYAAGVWVFVYGVFVRWLGYQYFMGPVFQWWRYFG